MICCTIMIYDSDHKNAMPIKNKKLRTTDSVSIEKFGRFVLCMNEYNSCISRWLDSGLERYSPPVRLIQAAGSNSADLQVFALGIGPIAAPSES